jgi:tetratricopeptide (TPR) repeat protein
LDAAKVYEAAASQASNPPEKARMLGFAAIEYAHESRIDRVSVIVVVLRRAVQNKEMGEQEFFNVLETLAEISKDKDLSIAVAERLVDLSPDNFRARFSLAYIHSEAGNDDLALHHYLKIPASERRAMDWNNLGVSFGHFKLPEKAVRAFRKSEELGETLAMGNLGNKMLNAGLFSEAQAICDKALATKEFHKSVGQLSIRLREVPEQETKDLTEVLEQAKPKIEFYRNFGRALGVAEPKKVGGTWIGPECELEATVTNDQIRLVGSYEREANPLSFGLGLTTRQPAKHRVEYTGVLKGCAIQGKITRSSDESAATKSLLSEFFAGATKVLMFVSDDEMQISVLENPAAMSPKVFIMGRSLATPLLSNTR